MGTGYMTSLVYFRSCDCIIVSNNVIGSYNKKANKYGYIKIFTLLCSINRNNLNV